MSELQRIPDPAPHLLRIAASMAARAAWIHGFRSVAPAAEILSPGEVARADRILARYWQWVDKAIGPRVH